MGQDQPDLWVFGYGSLMWRPDFPFAEAFPARLYGWHRRFCIASRYYRGTDARPGLVLGLDRGGVCDGRAFRVDAEHASKVLAYLRLREQISGVYREAHVPVTLQTESRDRHIAVTFLAERAHPSFTRRMPLRLQASIIAGAHGRTGSNLDYFVSTLQALRALGIREVELERLLVTVGALHGRAGRVVRTRGAHATRRSRHWPRKPVLRLADVKRFIHRRRMAGG